MEPVFRKANGELTRYAFGCGYVQTFNIGNVGHYATDSDSVALTLDGVWHVRFRNNGEFVWDSFDTYAEARKFWGVCKALIIARHNYAETLMGE